MAKKSGKDNRKQIKNQEHIGIDDISLISFGDNIFSRSTSERIPNLNNLNSWDAREKGK
jgi:hypothetical protein